MRLRNLQVTVTVKPTPKTTNTTPQLHPTVCSGTALNFTPTFSISGTTYSWTSSISGTITAGSVSASGSGAITDTPVNTGPTLGTVTYHITPAYNGCGLAFDYVVTILEIPTAAVSGGGVICSGATVPNVTFTFTGTAPYTFTYSTGSTPTTVSSYTSSTYTLTSPPAGTYSVTSLTDNGGCPATSLGSPKSVGVNALPTGATSGGGTVCSSAPLPGITFTFTGTAPFTFTYTDGKERLYLRCLREFANRREHEDDLGDK